MTIHHLSEAVSYQLTLTFMTRLTQHFCAPLFSPNSFQAIARDPETRAKRPTQSRGTDILGSTSSFVSR